MDDITQALGNDEDFDELDNTDSVDDTTEDTDVEQQPDKLALLESEIAALKNQNSKIVKDFSAAVGRYQSLLDRLESGKGDTDKLVKQVNSSIGAVEQVLDTILNDESVDESLRRRATEVRSRTKAETELAALRAELESVKTMTNKPNTVETNDSGETLTPLEQMLNTMIIQAGFNPTQDFDWNEASQIFTNQGEAGVIGYFTNKIAEKKAESLATSRRQVRKESASKTPSPASAARSPEQKLGDESLDLDERLATLRAMIANRI